MASSSDVVFSRSVKDEQTKRGSRAIYERLERHGGFSVAIEESLRVFLAEQRSFFFATANLEGQPYVQHRGGPPGFLKVLGPTKLGFADFAGNRQYISTGNLRENSRCEIFLVDYEHRRRVKVWGRARLVEDDPRLLEELTDPSYPAKVERAIVIEVEAWDVNCPAHIPWLLPAEEVLEAIQKRDEYIAELESRLGIKRPNEG